MTTNAIFNLLLRYIAAFNNNFVFHHYGWSHWQIQLEIGIGLVLPWA